MRMRKVLSFVLLIVSVSGIAISAVQITPYIVEEVQSALLYAQLAALHSEEGSGTDFIDDMMLDSPVQITTVPDGTYMENGEDGADGSEDDAYGDSADGDESDDDSPGDQEQTTSHAGLAALHQKNPDCVAWLTIPGTVIDYPVMYRPNQKDYYLHRDFNGKRASAGTLYISEICDPYNSDNVIIYGHHMSSGKMFAALDKYKKKSFYESHKRITFETLYGTATYEVLFAFTTPVYTKNDFQYYAFSKARSAAEFDAFLSACRSRALYNTGVSASYGDKLLTLSTCEYSQKNGRMVVVAKKIS